MTDELEPCPFCGDTAMVQRVGPNGNKWWELQCGGCGIVGPDRGNEFDAITAWNTRPSQWSHDMEAAPKEWGKWIMVYAPPTNSKYRSVDFTHWIVHWNPHEDGWYDQDDAHVLNNDEPTKWMHLPPE